MDRARELLARSYSPSPGDADIELVAASISAERRSRIADAITDKDLRAAHDQLYASSSVRRALRGVLESLAQALLARGVVPKPDDFDGDWWLWWPQQGRGPCQHCGNQRTLRRYSARFGKPYRYLCQRCRQQEVSDNEEYLNQSTGVIPEPGESADSLLLRRLTAIAAQAADMRHPPSRPMELTEDE